MAVLKAKRTAPVGTVAHDVLDGFAPGVYRVTVQWQGVTFGGADIGTGLEWTPPGSAPLELVTSPGELFVRGSGGSGSEITVLAVPYIGQS